MAAAHAVDLIRDVADHAVTPNVISGVGGFAGLYLLPDGRILAGFCVGLAAEEELLDPANVRPGDAIVGLRSSGLHSNGFSLVRSSLAADASRLHGLVPALGRTLADELLEPTAIYVRTVIALRR